MVFELTGVSWSGVKCKWTNFDAGNVGLVLRSSRNPEMSVSESKVKVKHLSKVKCQ